MPNSDDQRAAAGILSNLSGFLMTASLAMLAIEGALFAFVLGNRVVGVGYFAMSVLAFLGFVFSIVFGGQGITTSAEQLAKGAWTLDVASGKFSAQAGSAFLGLIFFLVSALLSGKPTETEIQKTLTNLASDIQTLRAGVEDNKKSDNKRAQEIETLSRNLDRIERASNSLKLGSYAKQGGKRRHHRRRTPLHKGLSKPTTR